MKRLLFLMVAMGVFLFGCSEADSDANKADDNEENNESEQSSETSDETDLGTNEDADIDENLETEDVSADSESEGSVDEEDFDNIFSDPLKYEGYEADFDGRVFVEPERDEDGVYLQVFADPDNQGQNVIVGTDDVDLNVETDDYVHVEGVIVDEFEGANPLGGQVTAPVMAAEEVEVIDYETAVSPAIETIEVDDTIDQHGYEMHVEKLETAENMTRVYVKISNNTDDTISFFSFNSKLVIDGEQLEEDGSFFEADFPEVQTEILPEAETEGVITYPAVDEDTEEMTFHAEGSSDNYELDFEPFEFDIEK